MREIVLRYLVKQSPMGRECLDKHLAFLLDEIAYKNELGPPLTAHFETPDIVFQLDAAHLSRTIGLQSIRG